MIIATNVNIHVQKSQGYDYNSLFTYLMGQIARSIS